MSNFTTLKEKKPDFSFHKIILSLFGIVFIRVFLENFSSPDPSGSMFPWIELYVHLPLFYVSIFLSLVLILRLITKADFASIYNFLIKIHLLIWIPPLFDLFVTKGKGIGMAYIITSASDFPFTYLKLINPFSTIPGITPGIKIAISSLIIASAIFVYKRTESKLKSFAAVFLIFHMFLFYSMLPSIFILFSGEFMTSASLSYNSMLGKTITALTANVDYLSDKAKVQLFNNLLMSQLFWILIFIQSLLLFYLSQKDKALTIYKNSFRFNRILNFSLIASIGIIISNTINSSSKEILIADIVTLLFFFAMQTLVLIFSVFINDEEDVEIDKITNKNRPLAQNSFSLRYWRTITTYIAVFILFGLPILNKESGFFLLLIGALYFLYSTKPLRLKKHFIFSSTIIAFITISSAMAGYFLVSPNRELLSFPFIALIIIGFSQALISNMKDIKDYEGDKQENIMTIPVIFGKDRGKIIIAFLWIIAFVSIPIVLKNSFMLALAIILSSFLLPLFKAKQYEEKPIFILLFVYMLFLYVLLV